ncbi:MAG: aminotransferase class I/II-fold pyridoxal phosphate-dependent enzyme [Gemmatimonadota bacterium]|jgi:O-acetylhomoserine/O-acetylserine sulfhydrylase-like pyridoxal-dependent enzyme|nr:aminotransferase class-V family protein [Gemmatimonadota bacterium]MDP6460587.1 aminotransferase class I/II-fold pyridoxal phosphate-dependent enzyme [Gemmatimonadota bacterium]MDP6529546.1 aminotransferase class I/II-fold pyridoxal phosphate-dependent enzyme [Gemmatimonadota bacterium]MDP6801812.1 aminotransferase class I/II-fold pyridoxal phosphate-dependent enzyme [Gemmatimonadota bacterium]MDP7032549.1 aminotransferase class I/II-fold pyridoxal phosphate-dependent enzyme [Gemmatimonadota
MNPHEDHEKGVRHWIAEGKRIASDRARRIARTKDWKFDTVATHGLYDFQQACNLNNGSIMEPVYLSPAQAFHDYDEMEVALAYQMPSWTYSRIANPSTFFLEETVALLESYGTGLNAGCVACSSGMSAIRSAIEPFLVKDDSLPPPNLVTTARLYGGTFQQFSERQMHDRGIEVRWVRNNMDMEEWAEKIDAGTRLVYGEMPSNPAVALFDIEKVAELAHAHGVPLIVDSTCASPALLRPLAFGADIVVQSVSKVMASHGMTIAGTMTARQNLPSRVGPDEMREDFATWVKLLPYRDNGPSLNPMSAILALNDLRSLRSRVAQMSRSALAVARFLESQPKVASIHYPGLESHSQREIADKYLTLVDSEHDADGPEHLHGYMMTFEVREDDPCDPVNTRLFYDALDLFWRATDLGRVKSVATLPAISTHQQQGDEGRALASIQPNYVRVSVGIEHVDDVIADLDRALDAIPSRGNAEGNRS